MRGKLPEEMVVQQNLGPIRVAGEGARWEGKMRMSRQRGSNLPKFRGKKVVSGGGACVILCGGCTGGDAGVGVRLWGGMGGWRANLSSYGELMNDSEKQRGTIRFVF